MTILSYLRKSIRARMLGGLLLMLLLFLGTVGTVFLLNNTQKSISVAINDCGKLRMLSQRIAKTAQMVANGDYAAREELMLATEDYDLLLNGLIYGDRRKGLIGAEGEIREQLEGLRELWSEYHARANVVLASERGQPRFDAAVGEIATSNTRLLDRANMIVSSYERLSKDRVDRLMAALYALLAAGVILFGMLVWALTRSLWPLKELVKVSNLVAQGDFSHRIEVRKEDEVGALARAFDAMIQKIARQVSLLELTVSRLEEAKNHAEKGLEEKSEFLAVMSHELRAPLNGIIGMTSILNQTVSDEEQKRFAEMANVSGKALLEIIDGVLDFSRIEAGKLEVERRPFDVRECVQEALDIVSYSAEAKGLSVETIVEGTVPARIVGDSVRLRQVLVNLLTNAVKFTDEGGVKVTVQGATGESQSSLLFSIEDTGIGIDEAEAHRLFKFYSQANASTSRTYGGTGLGLAIAKLLVEAMGGSIWVTSELGQGTRFCFTIEAPHFL